MIAHESLPAETRAPESTADLLERTLKDAPDEGVLAVHLPAPILPPEWLLEAFPEGPAFAWSPPKGAAISAVGAIRQIPAERWAEASFLNQASRLLEGLHERGALQAPPVRAFAALPFEAAAQDGPGGVLVPRWRYALDRNGAHLTLCVGAERHEKGGVARILDESQGVFDAAAATLNRRREGRRSFPGLRCSEEHAPEAFLQGVVRARDEIAGARLEKVVLARTATVEAHGPILPCDVLERLANAGWGTRYATRSAEGTFLGLSPERLISRRGTRVLADALAGTARHDAREDVLTGSLKDGHEHRLVVQGITRSLERFCEHVEVGVAPIVRRLRHVVHLHTAIEGQLSEPAHVLELVAALHPTPAVGGLPRDRALQFIAEAEPPRGLYAGPIGWFDRDGNGDFWVALRGGLINGPRATLWAGAGIVAGSDPHLELGETSLKMRPMLAALGGAG